jgi:hypothetical protein
MSYTPDETLREFFGDQESEVTESLKTEVGANATYASEETVFQQPRQEAEATVTGRAAANGSQGAVSRNQTPPQGWDSGEAFTTSGETSGEALDISRIWKIGICVEIFRKKAITDEQR